MTSSNRSKSIWFVARIALAVYILNFASSAARGAGNFDQTPAIFQSATASSFHDGEVKEDAVTVPPFSREAPKSPIVCQINSQAKFQTMWGYGAAMTEACAMNMDRLDQEKRRQLLRDIFRPVTGAGFNFVRVPLGGNDYSMNDFSLDETPNNIADPDLSYYDFSREEKLIPLLYEAKKLNPELAFMLTPWSAPSWMKDTKKLAGGVLEEQNYDAYAHYLIRSLKEFSKRGVDIEYMSIVNEPLIGDATKNWYFMQMYMSTPAMTHFIKDHLAPLLQEAYRTGELKTKLLLHDHNWGNSDYVDQMLDDDVIRSVVAGVAYHCYGGDVNKMKSSHSRHPEIAAVNTECTGMLTSETNAANFQWWLANETLDVTRIGATGALSWNLCLDNRGGPHNAGGCKGCRGAVTIGQDSKVQFNQEFHALAQMSRYVRRGARRIFSTDLKAAQGISNSAFQNPDGSLVFVARSDLDQAAQVHVVVDDNAETTVTVPARGAISVFWSSHRLGKLMKKGTNTFVADLLHGKCVASSTSGAKSGCQPLQYQPHALAKWKMTPESPLLDGSRQLSPMERTGLGPLKEY